LPARWREDAAGAPYSGLRDIRPGEIFADEKQRHSCNGRYGIRHTVPEIQSGRMTAPSESDKGGYGGIQVFLVERHYFGFQAAQKSEEHRTGIVAKPRGQHHRAFQ
jgi:hypothetical protein